MAVLQRYKTLHGFDLEGRYGDDPNKTITIAIDMFTIASCSEDPHVNLTTCDSLALHVALYFAKLLSPPGYRIDVKVFPDELYDDIFEEMYNGTVDSFPSELPLLVKNLSELQYFWPTPVATTGYYMYSSMSAIRDSISESPIQFLTAPFTWGAWLCAFVLAIGSFFLAPFIFKRRPYPTELSRRSFLIILFAFAFLAALYSSHLKALLAQQSTSIPFHNLYDLARKVENGQKRLLVEDKQSLRWNLLTNAKKTWKPPSFEALYDAIRKRGIDSAVLFEPNMTRVCQVINSSTEFVYFSYEDLVLSACGARMCLWKYRVTEYPETPVTIPVSKLSPLVEDADLGVHALENYRTLLVNRHYGGACIPEKMEKELIGMRSLAGALFLLLIGYGASTIVLIVERMSIGGRRVGFFYSYA